MSGENTCSFEGTCLSDTARLLDLVGNAGIGVFVLDEALRIADANDAWLRMFGLESMEQALGLEMASMLGDSDLATSWTELTLGEDCSVARKGELDYRRPDGTVGRAMYTVCPLVGGADKEQHIEGMLIDVSQRVRAEQLLQEANEALEETVRRRTAKLENAVAELERHRDALRTFFDNTHEAVFVHDLEGRLLDVNDRMLELYGIDREDVHGYTIEDYSSEKCPVENLPDIWRRVVDGENRSFPWIAKRQDDGSEFHVEVHLRRIVMDGEDVILANVVDMHETVLARENLELFRKVFENALEGISITDKHGTILSVNPAFTTITGYSAEEAIGQNPRILRSEHHDETFYTDMWRSLEVSGIWEGEIWNRRKSGEVYPEWLSISRIPGSGEARYIAVFHDITEMKSQEQRIEHQAQYDPLTDLPNRMLLLDRMRMASARAEREDQRVAVIFIDLDDFKNVNDALGHTVGDEILKDMARRMKQLKSNGDTLARIGSDEFVLLLAGVQSVNTAASVAERVAKQMNRPFKVRGHEVFLTASIGLAFYPDDGQTPEELLKNADLAMSRSKEIGKNTYSMYTPQMHEKANLRIRLEGDMRKGLMRQEFIPFYQPKIDARTGRVMGMEALVRWQRQDGTLVSPGEFIPLAEENGLIVPLSEQFAFMVTRQVRELEKAGHDGLVVSVNVSPRQFMESRFVSMLRDILDVADLEPWKFEVEITETAIMGDIERTVSILSELKDMGISIAIDDFGTGYSSLAYLKRFPIDVLKIDQSFVRDLTASEADAGIVSTIIDMARNMGMHTVAEGVETAEQAVLLKRLGCDVYQGFYYSKPLPLDEFRTWLEGGA